MESDMADLHCRIDKLSPMPLSVDFCCRAGEVMALVGPSGGGKTTLLRMIAGLGRPQQGEIGFGEQLWFAKGVNLSPQQRHIGYMPQHFGLFPHLSALENVVAGLDHIPRAQRVPRARDWLARVHLHALPDRLPAQLSGGQRQRVALARALAREPSVLLLDEPFSSVDRQTREGLYLELARLKHQLACPVIMVTHDLSEALMLADKMLLISHGGQMLQQGAPLEMLARPRSEAVARQLGLGNIFDGELLGLDAASGTARLGFAGNELRVATAEPQSLVAKTPGDRLRWFIPGQGIRFAAIRDGLPTAADNRLGIRIETLLPLGETVRILAAIPALQEPGLTDAGTDTRTVLQLEVPRHLAQKLALQEGMHTHVSLRPEQIRLLAE
jgi:molybdate transport system ATP-binding protein